VSVVWNWLGGAGMLVFAHWGARTLMPHHIDRPTKTCAVCGRPFQWRKKWKAVWDDVKYCSERCRGLRARRDARKPHDAE
jgi:hypothetical protein